jgi:hypothetical protein
MDLPTIDSLPNFDSTINTKVRKKLSYIASDFFIYLQQNEPAAKRRKKRHPCHLVLWTFLRSSKQPVF